MYPSVQLLDAPRRHGVQGRRAKHGSSAQAEAGMVPGAAHRFPNEKSLFERRPVVCAERTNREELAGPACDKYGFALRVSQQHPAVRDRRGCNALGQIRPA